MADDADADFRRLRSRHCAGEFLRGKSGGGLLMERWVEVYREIVKNAAQSFHVFGSAGTNRCPSLHKARIYG